MSDEYRTGAQYGQSVTQAAAYWLQVEEVTWEDEDEFWRTVLMTADKFYKELKARQDALLVRTPLRQSTSPTPAEMAADMASTAPETVHVVPSNIPVQEAPPPAQDYEEPPDEEVREGMVSTGVGQHNPSFWAATDTRCPKCGKATLVKKTGQHGPDFQCSLKEQQKTERLNEKGKNIYVDVGDCDFAEWPPRDW